MGQHTAADSRWICFITFSASAGVALRSWTESELAFMHGPRRFQTIWRLTQNSGGYVNCVCGWWIPALGNKKWLPENKEKTRCWLAQQLIPKKCWSTRLIMPNRHGNSTTFESTIWTCIDSAQVHMIYIYIFIYIYICINVHTYVHLDIYLFMRAHTHIYIDIYVHIPMYIYVNLFVCLHMHTFTSTYLHLHLHVHLLAHLQYIALPCITLHCALRCAELHYMTVHRHTDTHIYI